MNVCSVKEMILVVNLILVPCIYRHFDTMMEQFSMDADSRPDSPIILAQSPPGKEDTLSIQVCLLVPYWWQFSMDADSQADSLIILGQPTLYWLACPLGWGQVQDVGLRDFCMILTLLPPKGGIRVLQIHRVDMILLWCYNGSTISRAIWLSQWKFLPTDVMSSLLWMINLISKKNHGVIDESYRKSQT